MVIKGRGFTVVEVLIGIGLFAVVMPSILLGMHSVNQLNDRAADLSRANILAEQKIEALRSAGYNSLVVGDTTYFTGELSNSFTAPRSASYTIVAPVTGIKEILVDIEYNDRGRTRNLEYKALISELGVSQ